MNNNYFLSKFSILFILISTVFTAQTRVLYDFNTAGQLNSYFNGVGQVNDVTEDTSNGIASTGCLYMPSGGEVVYSTKDGYSMGPVGSTYKFIAYFNSNGSSGFGGFGFTASSPANASSISSPAGNVFRPGDALGISVHGAGFVFHNGSSEYTGYWVNGDGEVNIHTIKGSSTGVLDGTSPDGWYKCALEIKKVTSTTFDMKIEVWPCYADGTLLASTDDYAVHEVTGLTNSTVMNAPLIYSYFNLSGGRITAFDDYEVDLAGGATVIQQGAPVVLTSATSTTSGYISTSGNVTSDNGSAVTERGFVYSLATNPTTNDGKIIVGSGTGTFNGQTFTLSNGTYYVRAYATNSVGTSYGSENIVTISSGSLLVNDVNANKLSIFPNPAKDFTVVNGLSKGAEVSLYDATGKVVYKTKADATSVNITTSSFSNGIYLVKVGDKTSKLIISK